MSKYLDKWPALTSDSVQLDTLIHNMGMGQNIQFQDVCDFETDLFGNILALIVLFGESEDEERKKATEEGGTTVIYMGCAVLLSSLLITLAECSLLSTEYLTAVPIKI